MQEAVRMWPHVNIHSALLKPHYYAVWHRFYECVKEKKKEMATTKTQRLNHYTNNKMKF